MNDSQGIPAAPPDRDLPNHRRIREELLMKIDPDDKGASLRRKWGVPLGIAAGVAGVSIAAVAVFGGDAAAKPVLSTSALGAGTPASATATPSPAAGTPGASAAPTPATTPTAAGSAGAGSSGGGSGPSAGPVTVTPSPFTISSVATTPIDAGAVSQILASCLGSGASAYHSVIAVRTPVTSQDADGTVIAVNSAGQYVQCETKGNQGSSSDSPPTFINNRLWGAGHFIEFFDSTGSPAGQGQYLLLGAGHYTSDVAKITISYGSDSKQYPAIMAGGAFFYTSALSTGATSPGSFFMAPDPHVHAFNASGTEIYSQ